jgi:outer membrane protein OmpA-like peptidoglycan-associated protein
MRRVAALAAVLVAPSVLAQGFVAERLQPLGGAYDILGVESARVPPHLALSATVILSYAHRPLVLTAPGVELPLLSNQTTVTAGASIGLFDRLELSLDVPVVIYQATPALSRATGYAPAKAGGICDAVLTPKVKLYSGSEIALSIAAPFSLPTGDGDSYLGYGRVTASPRVIFEYQTPSEIRVAANLGVAVRGRRSSSDLYMGNALTHAIGAEFPFTLASTRFAAIATLAGEVAKTSDNETSAPLELLGGVAWRGPVGIDVTLGGGPGITKGYGTPRYRLFAAVSLRPASNSTPDAEPPASQSSPEPRQTEPESAVSDSTVPDTSQQADTPSQDQPSVHDGANEQEMAEIRRSTVAFAFQSHDVPTDFAPILDRIASIMKTDERVVLRIEGHADEQGPAGYNQALSERRARAVRHALIEKGVAAERIEALGFGSTTPLDRRHTLAAHRRNRRVEFVPVVGEP